MGRAGACEAALPVKAVQHAKSRAFAGAPPDDLAWWAGRSCRETGPYMQIRYPLFPGKHSGPVKGSNLMTDQIDLRSVDLGAPAAERDILRGLEHYFVKSDAFLRVTNRTKTIILGNRGV